LKVLLLLRVRRPSAVKHAPVNFLQQPSLCCLVFNGDDGGEKKVPSKNTHNGHFDLFF
jgi:hypothetical protein